MHQRRPGWSCQTQDLERADQTMPAPGGGGIVQHSAEIAGRRRLQPSLDLVPRRQQIGQ